MMVIMTLKDTLLKIELLSTLQLLLMIGESFEEHSDEVCGAVVNVRGKGDKIGVWTADAKKNDSILKIG